MTFLEALQAAMDTTDPIAYVDRVKKVVRRELRALDSSVELQDTRYFNHSAIPDFVATWPGERGERRIYLRDSYESISAARDERYLTLGDPVLLSLESEPDPTRLRGDHTEQLAGRTLLTDVGTVELLSESVVDTASPVAKMVQSNFVRGARGSFDRARAETLIDVSAYSAASEEGQLDSTVLINESFFEDAALRITRTAKIVEASKVEFDDQVDGQAVSLDISGRLSLAELRNLLPWLLRDGGTPRNPDFWRKIGAVTTFADLEKVREALDNLDVSPLVQANADTWEARWAYLGVAIPVEGDPTYLQRRNYWSFSGGALGIDVEEARVLIAFNGQLMPKSRSGGSSVRWDALRPSLVGQRLARVHLSGIRRSVAVSAEESPDVRGDIEEVARSLDDEYHVSEIAVNASRVDGISGDSLISINFESDRVTATKGASLASVFAASQNLLDRRSGFADTPPSIAPEGI